MWSDRLKSLSLPLFPNYVFCNFDIDARQPVLLTPGVRAVVGAGKSPLALDEAEVASLRQLSSSGLNAHPCAYLQEGERVHVDSGPLKGLTGIVIRANGRYRLTISVSLLKRSVNVEVDPVCVTTLLS